MVRTQVTVDLGNLDGPDGNAFAILSKVTKALKRNGHGDLAEQYKTDAMSGDYDHLLKVTEEYVSIE